MRVQLAIVLSVCALCAGHLFAAPSQEDSRKAKIAELIQLQGFAGMVEEFKAPLRAEVIQRIASTADQMSAQLPPNAPPEKRRAIEAAGRRLLDEIDQSFDRDDVTRAWERFYSEGLTDQELDAILAYYRSPAGRKDVRASQAAMSRLQQYILEKQTAAINAAFEKYEATFEENTGPAKFVSVGPPEPPTPSAGSNPSVPDGKVIANSVSNRCEAAPSAAAPANNAPATGRSVLCVCIDEKGKLTQDPVIAESSGDARVDKGAVKLARVNSGRYTPPTLDGKPQKGCFRYAVNFRHPE
jgi:hypothetical protein